MTLLSALLSYLGSVTTGLWLSHREPVVLGESQDEAQTRENVLVPRISST